MQFYAIKANDVAGFNIRPFLEPTAAYIDQALKSGGELPISYRDLCSMSGFSLRLKLRVLTPSAIHVTPSTGLYIMLNIMKGCNFLEM